MHRTEVVVDRDNFGRKILASFVMIAKYAAEGNCEMDREQKNDDFGPVHGGDAPPFLGGPMGSQYHLRTRM